MRIRKRSFKRSRRPIRRRKLRKVARRKRAARARRNRPEVKQNTGLYAYTSYNGVINTGADFLNVVPDIGVGGNENQRIGSRINPIKIVMKGYFIYKANTTYDAKMIGVRQFLLKPKTSNSNTNFVIDTAQLKILDFGGVTAEYDGTINHHLAPHNKDLWTFIKDKRYVIQKPYGIMNAGAAANADVSMQSVSPTMFRPFTFTIKKFPKQFIYDNSISATQPTNYSLYHAIGYTDLFNAAADTITQQIALSFTTTLYYTDP